MDDLRQQAAVTLARLRSVPPVGSWVTMRWAGIRPSSGGYITEALATKAAHGLRHPFVAKVVAVDGGWSTGTQTIVGCEDCGEPESGDAPLRACRDDRYRCGKCGVSDA